MTLAALTFVLTSAAAFTSPSTLLRSASSRSPIAAGSCSRLASSVPRMDGGAVGTEPNLRITGDHNLEVTDPMREYAAQKLGKPLSIHADVINSAQPVDVHLKVEHRGLHDSEHVGKEAHIAEITVSCKDKAIIRAESETETMYASLDELADMVSRKLRKHKEKRVDLKENRKRTDKERIADAVLADDEDEEFPADQMRAA